MFNLYLFSYTQAYGILILINIFNIGDLDKQYMGYDRWLPPAPKVKRPRSIYNAASLAYIGDCIYEVEFIYFFKWNKKLWSLSKSFSSNLKCLALIYYAKERKIQMMK